MSVPDINSLRDDLLLELAKRKANNGNPGHVGEICKELRSDIDWRLNHELARSAGWLLVRSDPPLAKRVSDSDRPAALLLALTAAGKSKASELQAARQPLSFGQRIQNANWTMWGVIVAALALFAYVLIELRKP